ncbi:MAG: phosphatase PAP2 family protein [Deltaproteobacteria bacterium]|nr:phosphatase PAP2 family protein [Deltaproteobacteria bacterium]
MVLYLPDIVGLALLAAHLGFAASYGPGLADPTFIGGAVVFVLLALVAFRSAQAMLPDDHAIHRWADWWACLALLPIYLSLNQILDAAHRPTMDAALIAADARLFGAQASVWLSRHMHPWLTDWLFLAYASYYFFVAGVGIWLGRTADRRVFHAYIAAIAGTFFLMMFGYIAVPAIGPRFTQAADMAGPLSGVFFGHHLDQSFKQVTFFRDCFPSGHTTQTLVAMYFGIRYAGRRRGLVAPALAIVGVSIIFATLYCRMHYAVDLLAALPLALFGITSCESLSRRFRPWAIAPSLAAYVRQRF